MPKFKKKLLRGPGPLQCRGLAEICRCVSSRKGSASYLELSHELIFQQLVFALERRLVATFLVPQSVESQQVEAQPMNLTLHVCRLGHLAADLRLNAKLLLCQYRMFVGHQLNLGRLRVMLLT